MSKLTLSEVVAALDAAYQTAVSQSSAQRVLPAAIGDNATLRTDLYTGPQGSGFAVVATMDLGWRKLAICRQHGPETQREQAAPALASLVAECDSLRSAAYESRGCSTKDYVDAKTKQSSSGAAMQAEGAAQEAAVLAQRLQIKLDLPKPL